MAGYQTGNGTTPDNNELTADSEYTYTYDSEGNEKTKTNKLTGDTWSYTYDVLNHLVRATDQAAGAPAGTYETIVTFWYDAFGNRVEEDVAPGGMAPAQVSQYAYDGWDPAKPAPVGKENWDVWADVATTTSGPSPVTRYIRGDVVDQVFARVDAQGTEWLLTDNQGSVRNVLSSTGVVLDSVTYDPYGNIVAQTATISILGRYGWTGREWDPTLGLQDNRGRWYDPEAGRWISQDPLGFGAGDGNLYRYVFNSPTNATDPSGMEGEEGFVWPWDRNAEWSFSSALHGLSAVGREAASGATDGLHVFNQHVTLGLIPHYNRQAAAARNRMAGYNGNPYGATDFAMSTAAQAAQMALSARLMPAPAAPGVAPVRSFSSFDALKRALGPAGEGQVWHHIVEQRAANVTRFGAEAIHNTSNVVAISREANQAIANYYSSIPRSGFTGGQTVRQWLGTQSFAEQTAFGRRILDAVLNGRVLP